MRIRYRHPIALITTTLLACACGIVSGIDEYGARDDSADGSTGTNDGGGNNDVINQVDGTSLVDTKKPDDDATTPPEEEDAGPPPPELDASSDVNGDAGVECPTNDSLNPPIGSRWLFRGAALSSPSGVVLTPDNAQRAGALFWNQPFTFNALDVTIKFKVENPSSATLIGDGIGIALISGASVPASLTGTGESIGFVNQSGYAFMVDTYRNSPGNDPVAPFFGARTLPLPVQWIRTHSLPYGVATGLEHTLRVVIANQGGGSGTEYKLSAVYDGNSIFGGVKLDNYSPVSGYLAIFAATGGLHALHRVTNVTFRAGKSGLCAVP